ncbi:hypothetical protein LZ32DRAFT_6690 [Colletotrichum eremochloae]|nr:hypothetical protein LZ32DRAFT_6690 [Colletotrichum eremochloae]
MGLQLGMGTSPRAIGHERRCFIPGNPNTPFGVESRYARIMSVGQKGGFGALYRPFWPRISGTSRWTFRVCCSDRLHASWRKRILENNLTFLERTSRQQPHVLCSAHSGRSVHCMSFILVDGLWLPETHCVKCMSRHAWLFNLLLPAQPPRLDGCGLVNRPRRSNMWLTVENDRVTQPLSA